MREQLAVAASALTLGSLAVAGFAPYNLYVLPVLSLAGLFLLWELRPRARAIAGFAFGLGLFGTGVSWVFTSLHVYGAMPATLAVLATLLFCAVLALFPWLTALIAPRFARAARTRLLLAWPACWVLTEWTRAWIFTGFPWLTLGYSQIPSSPLAGYAPVLGIHGVSWLLAACSGLLAWLAHARRRAWLPLIAMAAIALAGMALREIEWTQPMGDPLRVSLVQGNVPQDLKWLPEQVRATLENYAEMVRDSRGQLVVLPETALPLFLHQTPRAYLESLIRLGRARGADILVGVPEQEADGRYYNSVVSLGASAPTTYRKEHLVPFGETIPLKPVFGRIVEVLHIPLADFSRGGAGQRPMRVAGQRVAMNICYEDVFGNEIVRQLPEASLLVNVSNDAWFGDSAAPWQHMQMSQARALETGRMMLRATNTGMTAIIDERGHVVDALAPFTRGTLEGAATGREGATPYVNWGNAPVLAALGLLAVAAAARRIRSRA
jgi:apolipoprotein N-acyltransferase